jgi:hypothetical protein
MARTWNTRGKELCLGRVGPLALVVAGNSWDDAAWREHCSLYAKMVADCGAARAVFNLSPRAGPSSSQRRMLMSEYRERNRIDEVRRFAILTESALVRGVLTALGWFAQGTKTAAYAPTKATEALAWLREDVAFDVADAVTAFRELMTDAGHPHTMLPGGFWNLTNDKLVYLRS